MTASLWILAVSLTVYVAAGFFLSLALIVLGWPRRLPSPLENARRNTGDDKTW